MTSELCKYVTNGNLRRNVKGKRMVFISMCLGKKDLRLAITIIGILDVICSSDLLTECILVIIEPYDRLLGPAVFHAVQKQPRVTPRDKVSQKKYLSYYLYHQLNRLCRARD